MSLDLDYGRGRRGTSRVSTGIAAARQNAGLLGQMLLLLAAVGLIGLLALGLLSLIRPWMLVVVTMALGGVVYYRTRQEQQRTWWVDNNCCAQCGYDLENLPTHVCPECGRDATLDEPTWRRLRREHEAQFGRPPQASETFAASQLDEVAIRRLLDRANESVRDL